MNPLAQSAEFGHHLSLSAREYLAYALVALMFVIAVGVLMLVARYRKVNEKKNMRVRYKFKRRAIQFFSVGLLIPTILILALDGILGSGALATIIGAFIGYVLSGIGEQGDTSS